MSIFDGNSPEYQQFIADMKTSWLYRSLARVTPRQAGWVFCGSALLMIFLIIFSIFGNNANYTFIFFYMITFSLTLLAGLFGIISWLDDRYIKDEGHRISARCGLHIGVFFYLIVMTLTILGFLH